MFKNTKNDYIGWLVIIGAIILVMEILFFNSGLIFSLFISGGMIYLGRKRAGKKKGKILFIGGIIFLVLSLLNMMTFKFLLVAILLHFFIQFLNAKKKPKKISPEITEIEPTSHEETVIKSEPLFENIVLGQQKTPPGAYEWNDVNIQAGIGDTIIDLSFTMLPKGETVIFIRNLIGNIQILVPYDIDVSVQHSCIMGSTTVFEHHDSKLFNRVLHLKTAGYETAEHKVKIFTSLMVGNLEVSRI
ncbi:cell wall-active antibiotics response protein [Bacillus sp. ISL-40]|uniref:cell wall-active antibiotics response protein LiaF n=1 Tax=unclassified Bacillus (in: firmicutes) TaxID=185979 RepID=UPI001BE5C290|nr:MULTISPECIES: cell wall-active antibiotics response protein LiaF [unclassified Bacillus (in: firmicutes)]MBT2697290.1 cell wall-active antibiotics response protein [Bacillus sp. ISL-40]MBT2741893.1 cell wall-active antibiotics response protein [Bacillus sp. ISL-77]